jgi:hypothetical protein
MIKILAAIGGAALLAGIMVLLTGMRPIDPATSQLAYGRADRMDVRSSGCGERGWPYYEGTCPRTTSSEIKRVGIVTTDRLPSDLRNATSR